MGTSIKRKLTIGFGAGTLALSMLASALTSTAAADEKSPQYEVGVAAPMVQPGSQVINRLATNDMRTVETDIKSPAKTPARRMAITSGNHTMQAACEVEFEGSDPLMIQQYHAINTFVVNPWIEQCGGRYTYVTATKYNHLHLGYENTDIGLCGNGPLASQFAFINDNGSCTEIDPLTEPRIAPMAHANSEVVQFQMYDADGYQPFRLDGIRIVNRDVRLCAQKQPPTDTIVSNTNDGTSSTQCWILEPGYWNLASYTSNTKIVTMTGADEGGSPFSFDDMKIVNQ